MLGRAAEHLIDGSEKRICRLSFIKGAFIHSTEIEDERFVGNNFRGRDQITAKLHVFVYMEGGCPG